MRAVGNDLTPGERLSFYRRRRGMSQSVLAGLVGRTQSWVEKIEAGRMPLDVLSNISALAKALDISVLDLLPSDILDVDPTTRGKSIPALRDLVLSYRFVNPRFSRRDVAPLTLAALKAEVASVFDGYQHGRFAYAVSRLQAALPAAVASLGAAREDQRPSFATQLAYLYQAAASVLTKVGELDLAMLCADRGETAVQEVVDQTPRLSLQRSIAHALLSNAQLDDARAVVEHGISSNGQPTSDPAMLSTLGSLHLVGSMASARAGDRPAADQHLRMAGAAAHKLGRDANHLWTAFGPTNVAIHRVAVASELRDYQLAADLGPKVDVSGMPIERQVRHRLEVARALHHRARQKDALGLVLEAEHLAPEHVRRHFLTHALIQEWLRSKKAQRTVNLYDLARRCQILPTR